MINKTAREQTVTLLALMHLAVEGSCIESLWGKCPYPESNNQCGKCFVDYLTKLGYVQKDPDQSLPKPSGSMASDGQELYGEIMLNAGWIKVKKE